MAARKFLVIQSGPNGAVGGPTYGFTTSASGAGLYATGTDAIALATTGVQRLSVNSSGAVTIATPTSGTGLTISGGGASIVGTLNMNTNTVTGVASPVAGSDAVNLTYLQANSVSTGTFDWKNSVRAASLANITLPPGGTTLTIDGVSLANNERVLLTNQTTGLENGIYVVSGIGSSVVLTRATDTDATGEMTLGTNVYVQSGTVGANVKWAIIATSNADGKTITVGTDTPTFSCTITTVRNIRMDQGDIGSALVFGSAGDISIGRNSFNTLGVGGSIQVSAKAGFNGATPAPPPAYTVAVGGGLYFGAAGTGMTFAASGFGLRFPTSNTWDSETLRYLNTSDTSINQIARVVNTIIKDLKAIGLFS